MALEPIGYILPRRPPVPNGITVQNTSSSSCHLPAADVRGHFVRILGVARLGEPGPDILGGRGGELSLGHGLVDELEQVGSVANLACRESIASMRCLRSRSLLHNVTHDARGELAPAILV